VPTSGAACSKLGGSELTAAEGKKTTACNGEKGKEGTFGGGFLPSGKTLTGAYSASGFFGAVSGYGTAQTGASFAMPVATTTEPLKVQLIKVGEPLPVGCSGEPNKPGAAPGNLCVFAGSETNVSGTTGPFVQASGDSESDVGFTITCFGAAEGVIQTEGTWAVTAK
jgi:hypothetical protein